MQLELLCQQLYESQDVQGRAQAEKALVGFTENPDSLPQCQLVLERSQVCMIARVLLNDVFVSTSMCSLVVSVFGGIAG